MINTRNISSYNLDRERQIEAYHHDYHKRYNRANYNGKEITFNINRVEGTLSSNPTVLELEFYNKYQELLNRINELLERRARILPSIPDNVIEFKTLTPKQERISDNKVKNSVVSYSNYLADSFVIEHQRDGINKLLRILNELDKTDNPVLHYNQLVFSDIPPVYLQELLEWAATYSTKAQAILDYIAEQRMNKFYELSVFPSYEDRITKNMIDLHL